MQYRDEDRGTNVLGGLLIGLVLGVGLALLGASVRPRPRPRRIRDTAGSIRRAASQGLQTARQSVAGH
jgi:hypothetical protein